MRDNKIWIGTKESDILYTNGFFRASITACGEGINGNYSFSKETNHRINYNAASDQYNDYILHQLANILENNPETEIMYYNPYYAHLLSSHMQQHVCCLNEKFVLDILRSKCEMRIMASEHIPVVPFSKVLGKDILKTVKCDNATYVIQENISSGGDGTYIISDSVSGFRIYDDEIYLVSHYYEKNIPVNINLIIFDNDIIMFPPSIQIVKRVENKLLFMGSDYYTDKFGSILVFRNYMKTHGNWLRP